MAASARHPRAPIVPPGGGTLPSSSAIEFSRDRVSVLGLFDPEPGSERAPDLRFGAVREVRRKEYDPMRTTELAFCSTMACGEDRPLLPHRRGGLSGGCPRHARKRAYQL